MRVARFSKPRLHLLVSHRNSGNMPGFVRSWMSTGHMLAPQCMLHGHPPTATAAPAAAPAIAAMLLEEPSGAGEGAGEGNGGGGESET